MKLFALTLGIVALSLSLSAQTCNPSTYPFSTSNTNLTVWNGEQYVPFFVKGINIGAGVPGSYPGQLAATRSQYSSWLEMIHEAGFNTIRLYTLHFPRFYEVLDSFNNANPQHPIYLFQGVWLSESITGYQNNLQQFSPKFTNEIEENIDCIHGNRTIGFRYGKAYGTYTADVSEWTIAYIIGREIYAQEVIGTNNQNPSDTVFNGNYLSQNNIHPGEYFALQHLDHLLTYEMQHYSTQRPVSFSSWPTLDPMEHPYEPSYWEDAISIDLNNIDDSKAPAGYFAAYHVYPYYPDFISDDPGYQQAVDAYGPNSYFGYVKDLRAHYNQIPLIIAEYGVPSSWGIGHFASNGMNHGGFSEYEQGQINFRLLESIDSAGCGGGMQFAWIDEWFKGTWITNEMDYDISKRIRWHNITTPEQNYGLLAFDAPISYQVQSLNKTHKDINKVWTGQNFDYYQIKIDLLNPLSNQDTLWIGVDTYADTLGESVLPNGDTLERNCEFALRITNHSAELYVTESYDLFGKWHGLNIPGQEYQSTLSNSGKWNLVRWKNDNEFNAVQYIGDMKLNTTWQPIQSTDAVVLDPDSIRIKLPWTLIQFSNPAQMKVIHDDKNTSAKEEYLSEGIGFSIVHNNIQVSSTNRLTWNHWSQPTGYVQRKKDSYYYIQNMLPTINSKAIAHCDQYAMNSNGDFGNVSVLDNDMDLDGNLMMSVLTTAPQNGNVYLNFDGTFSYVPNPGFTGIDEFKYCIFDGHSLSESVSTYLQVPPVLDIDDQEIVSLTVYPNPSNGLVNLKSNKVIMECLVFNLQGALVETLDIQKKEEKLNLEHLAKGSYLLLMKYENQAKVEKILIQ